jgi:hypothetical protein
VILSPGPSTPAHFAGAEPLPGESITPPATRIRLTVPSPSGVFGSYQRKAPFRLSSLPARPGKTAGQTAWPLAGLHGRTKVHARLIPTAWRSFQRQSAGVGRGMPPISAPFVLRFGAGARRRKHETKQQGHGSPHSCRRSLRPGTRPTGPELWLLYSPASPDLYQFQPASGPDRQSHDTRS